MLCHERAEHMRIDTTMLFFRYAHNGWLCDIVVLKLTFFVMTIYTDDENLDRTKMSIFVALLNQKFSTNVKKRNGLDHYRAILPKNTNSER